MPEKGPVPITKSRLPAVRRPKRVRNLLIAAAIGAGLAMVGWRSGHWSWAIAGAGVFVVALLSTWFSRKLGVLVVGMLRILAYNVIRFATALVFYGIATPIALLSRLQPRPWRASEQVLADDAIEEGHAPAPSMATRGGLLRPKSGSRGAPSYAAPPRRPPTAADFERLR